MRKLLIVCSSTLFLSACSDYRGDAIKSTEIDANELPSHTVEITSLGAKGQRVQINVQVDFLPKAECQILINH